MHSFSKQQAQAWLKRQGYHANQLTPLAGYTNHVFKVEGDSFPQQSIIRLANHQLNALLCPLAHNAAAIIQRHQQAASLGLAPPVIASDAEQGIIWLHYAGKPKQVTLSDVAEIQHALHTLHQSDFDWRPTSQDAIDAANLVPLQQLAVQTNTASATSLHLLQLAEQRGYAQQSAGPVHSDLNPGNCLHDGTRWWLIDWDFSTQKTSLWDYASLIVEHDWRKAQVAAFKLPSSYADLSWFCCNFALLSWDWHQQRGTHQAPQKWQQVQYWQTQLT